MIGTIVKFLYYEYRQQIENVDTSFVTAYGQITKQETIEGNIKYFLTNVIRDNEDRIIFDIVKDYTYQDEILGYCHGLNKKWESICFKVEYAKTQILNILKSMCLDNKKIEQKIGEVFTNILQELYVEFILNHRKEMRKLFSVKKD